jgi:hypothetical protein
MLRHTEVQEQKPEHRATEAEGDRSVQRGEQRQLADLAVWAESIEEPQDPICPWAVHSDSSGSTWLDGCGRGSGFRYWWLGLDGGSREANGIVGDRLDSTWDWRRCEEKRKEELCILVHIILVVLNWPGWEHLYCKFVQHTTSNPGGFLTVGDLSQLIVTLQPCFQLPSQWGLPQLINLKFVVTCVSLFCITVFI